MLYTLKFSVCAAEVFNRLVNHAGYFTSHALYTIHTRDTDIVYFYGSGMNKPIDVWSFKLGKCYYKAPKYINQL